MPDGAAYILSDAHLGADPAALEAPRARALHEFLSSLPGRAETLVIAGDLFDFWFEYRTAIPRRYFETLAVLRRVREAGVRIHYLCGNHDFWLGRFLREELGIETRDGPLTLEAQGRRLWIHHGDGLIGGDLGYRILRRVIRHPVSIALYGWLHPDLGIPLALWVSRFSRHSRDGRALDGERLVREIAAPRFAEGYDAVMVGHFHQTYEYHEAGRDFFVLGDWIDRFTYVVLEAGCLTLETWPPAATVAAPARRDALRTAP
jgi:UDP-2,3-diacylglucosamine hydrolase